MLENNFNKEIYENGDVRLEIHRRENGNNNFWLQVGIAGLWLNHKDAESTLELVKALLEEEFSDG